MVQTPRIHATAAATLFVGFLVGSHPLVAQHPLLRGVASADTPAAPSPAPVACAGIVGTPAPQTSLPTRLAALRDAELEERAQRAARQMESTTGRATTPVASASGAATIVPGSTHPRIEEVLVRLTTTPEGRRRFETWLERRVRYQSTIEDALARQGLPPELAAVAFVESDLVPTAVSRVGATGLWQFMPATARAYGLTVEPGYDERRSVVRASEAAARYLADLHEHFGSWELALAAYNSGFGRIQEVVETSGSWDFWALAESDGRIPDTTPHYVAQVMAAAHVLRRLGDFGFRLPERDEAFVEPVSVAVPGGAAVWQLARAAGIEEPELRELNPELLGDVLPMLDAELAIRIPSDRAERARIMIPLLATDEAERTSAASNVPAPSPR